MFTVQCVKIKLREGCIERAQSWAAELQRRSHEVLAVLQEEGVQFEACFLDRQDDGDYLIYVMRAQDFERAAKVAAQSVHAIDAYHHEFKDTCWETRKQLPRLFEFARPEE